MKALMKAAAILGGVTKMASVLKVGQPAVSNWIARGEVPPKRCRPIERATAGAVTAEELRPDIFGPAEIAPRRKKRSAK